MAPTGQAISLIYGDQVLDDLEFCTQHNDTLERYSKGIMTLHGSPLGTLESVARDPARIPGWTDLLGRHPDDYAVLQEFFRRLINYYLVLGRKLTLIKHINRI